MYLYWMYEAHGSSCDRKWRHKDSEAERELHGREAYKEHRVPRLELGYGAPQPSTIYEGNIRKQGTVDKLNIGSRK